MNSGVAIQGSTVALIMGARSLTLRGADLMERRFQVANDNGSATPVQTVTVRRKLEKSGVVIRVKVPVDEFIGVAVMTGISAEGELSSAIELVHSDPELNYKVFEETGNATVVAEWQNWGRKLRLPLYIKAGDGRLLPYTQTVDGVSLGVSTQRRRLTAEANRRPRFLNRRKPGSIENT